MRKYIFWGILIASVSISIVGMGYWISQKNTIVPELPTLPLAEVSSETNVPCQPAGTPALPSVAPLPPCPITDSGSTQEDANGQPQLNTFSIIDPNDSTIDQATHAEYQRVLGQFIENDRVTFGKNRIGPERENLDTKTLLENKEIFIKLFALGKLPVLETFTVGGNQISISAPYTNVDKIPELTPGEHEMCGLYFSPGGIGRYHLCLAIVQSGTTYDVKTGMVSYKNNNTLRVANNDYIMSSRGDFGAIQYQLYDSSFNPINTLVYHDNTFDENSHAGTYVKGIYAIKIGYGLLTPEIPENAQYKQIELVINDIVVGTLPHSGTTFSLDPEKNLLNGEQFEFVLDGKTITLKPEDFTKSTEKYTYTDSELGLSLLLPEIYKNTIVTKEKFSFGSVISFSINTNDQDWTKNGPVKTPVLSLLIANKSEWDGNAAKCLSGDVSLNCGEYKKDRILLSIQNSYILLGSIQDSPSDALAYQMMLGEKYRTSFPCNDGKICASYDVPQYLRDNIKIIK